MSERPPRVLHVGKYLPPVPGGIETYLGDLLRVSMRHGMPVGAIVHEKKGYPKPNPDDFGGATIYSVPTYGQLLYAPLAPSFPWRLRQAIRDFKPDILHLHMPNTSVFAALLLPEARRIPWVVHWQADVSGEKLSTFFKLASEVYKPLEQRILRRADRVFATSDEYLQASSSLLGHKHKVIIAPLAIDQQRLTRRGHQVEASVGSPWNSSCAVRVLCVGRLTYYKGYEYLIRAARCAPHVSIAIVGEGDLKESLDALIFQIRVADRIKLLGYQSDEVVFSLMQSADYFCMPSIDRSESFGLAMLEARAMGCELLVSSIPGSAVAKVARSLGCSRFFLPHDVESLSGVLTELAPTTSRRRDSSVDRIKPLPKEYLLDRASITDFYLHSS